MRSRRSYLKDVLCEKKKAVIFAVRNVKLVTTSVLSTSKKMRRISLLFVEASLQQDSRRIS